MLGDSFRAPDHQVTARIYIRCVGAYQHLARPLLAPYVRCRFRPTCSDYSAEAVRRYGIRKGLVMTVGRVWRCRDSVAVGTPDPP